jgi:hypothetical protein
VTTSAAGQDAGTLVADNRGGVTNCFADGTVTATGTGEQSFIGGLVGMSSGSIQGSGADVTASGQSFDIVGGLVGMNFPTSSLTSPVVFQSYATGPVSAPVDNGHVGGLIGENDGGVTFGSYARGAVTGGAGKTSYIGGLIGFETVNPFNGRGPILNTSYSTGAVGGGAKAVIGGMLGIDIQGFSNIDDYWDLGTSGIGKTSQGAGNPSNDPGLTGLRTRTFRSALPDGFDPTIWGQDKKINDGYPYLLTNPPR